MPTARKLPSGSWRCQVFSHYEMIDGKKKRIYKSFTSDDPSRAGKDAAELAAAEYRMAKKISGHNMLFKDAADLYISGVEPVLSTRTIQSYKSIKRLYLEDLYQIDINDITQDQIQDVINTYALKLSPKTVRNIHGFISAVMGKYRPDFALRTALPKKVRPDLYVPSDANIKRLMAFCEGTEMELPILLAAFGPMRRGEICALESKHINGRIVHVYRNMVINENNEWIIKQPKNYAGDRYIEYPAFVAKKWKGIKGRLVNLNPNQITHRFADMLDAAGLPHFRFHDLRHYSASIQHALGIPDSYIMQRGGWSSDTVLKSVYRHAMESQTKKMNKLANDHFSNLVQHKMQHENS